MYKYKYVEKEKCYKEYEKLRLWVVIVAWVSLIALSPIMTLIALISEGKQWFIYPMGDGREEYTYIMKDKEETENNGK